MHMAAKPSSSLLPHHATTSTLPMPLPDSQPDIPEPKDESGDREPEHGDVEHEPDNRFPVGSSPNIQDILLLFGIFVMLIWPWTFLGAVWAKKGIQMNNRVAKVVRNNPHATTYVITLVCTVISMIVTAFFSLAIVRFSQELVMRYRPSRPFHLRVLFAFRHQTWPWGKKDVKYLMARNTWWPTVSVIICILTFPHLVSTTTSLITPIPFNRTTSISGTELDFSATDPVCLDWFKVSPLSNDCDWNLDRGQFHSNCLGENQMVDALEAGRGNILELVSNNSQSLTFSQLGAGDGLRFLGSIRGVLPIGPNGVPTLNTFNPSPFTVPEIMAGVTSYSYTLNHQGLNSKVSCSYQPMSPIIYEALSNDTVTYNVPNCGTLEETNILTGVPSFTSVRGKKTLMYWACQSRPNNTRAPSYSIYLLGYLGGYEQNIGNITCTVSATWPANFPVTYQSSRGIFSVGAVLSASETAGLPPSAFSLLVNYTLIALGGIISEGQLFNSNLAESVTTFGVMFFGLQPYARNSKYLQLYEQMIQGILEYQTTYMRSIYSRVPDPPPSCIRAVTGFVKYEVFGWFVTSANIGFLIPMTLVNGAALIALLLALAIAKVVGYFHPHHPRRVVYDPNSDEEVHDEWMHKVAFQPTTVLREHFDGHLRATRVRGGIDIATASAMHETAWAQTII